MSAIGKNAVISRCTKGGKSVNLPPSGAAWTRFAATTTADAFEVIPILVAPLRKSVPQGIPGGDTATVKASINAEVLANSDDDDSGNDEYSYFGEHPNHDYEDHLPRDICGDFILLFVGSRKCQLTYLKVRKVDVLLLIELVLSHRFTYNIQVIFKLLLLCLYLIPYITAMQECIIHRMDVAINYFLNHSFHCLQIFHL